MDEETHNAILGILIAVIYVIVKCCCCYHRCWKKRKLKEEAVVAEVAEIKDLHLRFRNEEGRAGFSMVEHSDGSVCVASITTNGPAHKSGLKTNDNIVKINGRNVTNM